MPSRIKRWINFVAFTKRAMKNIGAGRDKELENLLLEEAENQLTDLEQFPEDWRLVRETLLSPYIIYDGVVRFDPTVYPGINEEGETSSTDYVYFRVFEPSG